MITTRKRRARLTLAVCALALLGSPVAVAADGAHQHAHGAGPSTLQLDNGKQWATDAPLRQGMANIRAAFSEALPAIHANKFSAAQYQALAQTVNAAVGDIVANCKLAPQADAQLHLIIAELLQGAETMQANVKLSKRRTGAIQVLNALEQYAAYFDHPGWLPIKH